MAPLDPCQTEQLETAQHHTGQGDRQEQTDEQQADAEDHDEQRHATIGDCVETDTAQPAVSPRHEP